jgi:ribonuclease P protein component
MPTHRLPQAFPKTRRILRREDFQQAFSSGARVHGRYVTVVVAANAAHLVRLGIVASRKLGNAVVRNRAKRLIREVFRKSIDPADARGLDLVVIPRRELNGATYASLEGDFRPVLRRCLSRHSGHGR